MTFEVFEGLHGTHTDASSPFSSKLMTLTHRGGLGTFSANVALCVARRAIKVDLRANFFPVKLQGELCIDATFAALGTFQTQSLHQNISPHPEKILKF